jgi:hypothetical protein
LHERTFVHGNAELRRRFDASRARFDLLFAACDGLPIAYTISLTPPRRTPMSCAISRMLTRTSG